VFPHSERILISARVEIASKNRLVTTVRHRARHAAMLHRTLRACTGDEETNSRIGEGELAYVSGERCRVREDNLLKVRPRVILLLELERASFHSCPIPIARPLADV
jgi:hypothetical protein